MSACPTCGADPCRNPSFCATCREAAQRRARGGQPRHINVWGDRHTHIPRDWQLFNGRGGTPQATIEGIMHSVRERGLGSLKEPANIYRLVRCDQAAKEQIDRRIAKLVAEGRVS